MPLLEEVGKGGKGGVKGVPLPGNCKSEPHTKSNTSAGNKTKVRQRIRKNVLIQS